MWEVIIESTKIFYGTWNGIYQILNKKDSLQPIRQQCTDQVTKLPNFDSGIKCYNIVSCIPVTDLSLFVNVCKGSILEAPDRKRNCLWLQSSTIGD